MSDNWRQKPQYKADVEQADVQVGVVDVLNSLSGLFKGTPLGAPLHLGRTDFENHDLNQMIDLVEHANPEHLEQASKTLWDARTAIHDAATDLDTNLGQVDWEGEGADAFHKWTKDLVNWTKELATYADVAATQIDAAASGLASVRKSMPPRDHRPAADQQRPHDLPKAKQVDTNPDYTAAVRVEKNRQEAINQMNRLASFYSVSAMTLKAAPEPEPLRGMPDVGVPRPPESVYIGKGPTGSGATASHVPVAPVRRVDAESHAATASPHHAEAGGAGAHIREVHAPDAPAVHDVGTEINTVGTLPPPATTTPMGQTAPTLPTAGAGGGQVPPPFSGPVAPPITSASGRSTGYGPVNRLPLSGQGRSGPSGGAPGRVPQGTSGQPGRTAAGGRTPQGPLGQAARATGRSVSTGQSPVRGAAQQSGHSPMGRGVTGGTPRMTNAPMGRAGGAEPAGAVRNGVVGGKPVTNRAPGGAAGSRVPRGTVVGAEGTPRATQPKGQLGRQGVVGAPVTNPESGARQAVLRSVNPNGVVGVSRDSTDASKGAKEAGARGANGLGRGTVGGAAEREQNRPSRNKRRGTPKQSD
ncbi:hypothetical protein [Streptomyces sp. NPDC047024]|uniref:WXG100 family type VII secretion target n=1 Tax=Streptomyces sp. NPDC047024 TaxID=3155476 RepID=UPI0033C10718